MRTALIAWAGAVALGLATPVCAQTGAASQLAPGEILLHIAAQGSAPADYATMEISVAGQGASKEEAEAARAQSEKDVLAALAEAGIARSRVEPGETLYSEYEDYDYAAAAVADAAADAAANEAAGCDECDDAYGATLVTQWNASSTMSVTVDDVAKVGSVMEIAGSSGYGSSTRPVFAFRDEAKSRRAAIVDALAQAKADAEVYADALGYRVVRIAAVGNDSPDMTLPGFLQTMMTLDGAAQEWSVLGQKTAPVTVDFVIAPK